MRKRSWISEVYRSVEREPGLRQAFRHARLKLGRLEEPADQRAPAAREVGLHLEQVGNVAPRLREPPEVAGAAGPCQWPPEECGVAVLQGRLVGLVELPAAEVIRPDAVAIGMWWGSRAMALRTRARPPSQSPHSIITQPIDSR